MHEQPACLQWRDRYYPLAPNQDGCGHLFSCLDRMFSDQDKVLIESTLPRPERLSRTDEGVIAWRGFAATHARRRSEEHTLKLDVT
jgi:hypothetical protein